MLSERGKPPKRPGKSPSVTVFSNDAAPERVTTVGVAVACAGPSSDQPFIPSPNVGLLTRFGPPATSRRNRFVYRISVGPLPAPRIRRAYVAPAGAGPRNSRAVQPL